MCMGAGKLVTYLRLEAVASEIRDMDSTGSGLRADGHVAAQEISFVDAQGRASLPHTLPHANCPALKSVLPFLHSCRG